MYQVYGDINSGNCYKVKLLLQILAIEHQWNHVDILAGQAHTAQFLVMNSNAKVPVLQISESEFLTESNAILNYLAEGTSYLPDSGIARARVLQWQFFEQYSHEPYIATARYINIYLGLPKEREAEYHGKQEGGHKALAVMNTQLEKTPFLVGDTPTIADISLFAYSQVAHEGGFDLQAYGALRAWLEAIKALPNYLPMNGQG